MKWTTNEINISQTYSRCFHAAAAVGENVYLHGGVKKYPSDNTPLNDVVVFNCTTRTLSQLHCKTSGPPRSHHTAVSVDDNTLCFVGGWDGKKRTTDVWLLDVTRLEWMLCKPGAASKPPAGLSSHTCVLNKPGEMIVTGREGGVRMQRRFGSVFKLKLDLIKKSYVYEELPYHISSRSGHTCCGLSNSIESTKTSLVIVGGRDSKDADRLPLSPHPRNVDLGRMLHQVIRSHKPMVVGSKSIRNHSTLPAGDLALIHGGEVFGRARESIIADLFIHDSTATRWWKIQFHGDEGLLLRMGHTLAWMNNRLYIIGGISRQRGDASNSVTEIIPPEV